MMKSRLKVVNLDVGDTKISAYTKVIEINPKSSTRVVKIKEEVVEPSVVGNETSEVRFDGFIHWFYGVVGTYVGGLAGEAMTMQDSLVVEVAEVDMYAELYLAGMIGKFDVYGGYSELYLAGMTGKFDVYCGYVELYLAGMTGVFDAYEGYVELYLAGMTGAFETV